MASFRAWACLTAMHRWVWSQTPSSRRPPVRSACATSLLWMGGWVVVAAVVVVFGVGGCMQHVQPACMVCCCFVSFERHIINRPMRSILRCDRVVVVVRWACDVWGRADASAVVDAPGVETTNATVANATVVINKIRSNPLFRLFSELRKAKVVFPTVRLLVGFVQCV